MNGESNDKDVGIPLKSEPSKAGNSGWQTLSSADVYETLWIKVRRDEVVTPSGKCLTYSVVSLQHPSAYVVAINGKNEILLEYNYRYPINEYKWVLPAGHGNEGESLLETAKRELLEETGMTSDDWISLGKSNQANGIADIPGEIFMARDVQLVTDKRDETEDIIEQKFFSQSALEDMVRKGTIDEGVVVAALYLARLYMEDTNEQHTLAANQPNTHGARHKHSRAV